LRETSSVLPKNQLMERGRAEGLTAVEEEILERVEEDPMINTRQLAREVGISHWTVWRTLQENLLHSYIQRVQTIVCPPTILFIEEDFSVGYNEK
jgi:DNA-binding Lrp family transcriptional regulator